MNDAIETNANLASETLIPMNRAGKEFPTPVSRTALERWIRSGVRGIRLESILIGTRRFTSTEAIARFIEKSNRQQSLPNYVRRTPAEIEQKKREFFGQ